MLDGPIRAISDPRRRQILAYLGTAERSAGEIAAELSEVSFGAVSQGLRILKGAGLVEVRKDGRHRYYRARPEGLKPLMHWLDAMWGRSLERLRDLAEAEETH